MLLFIVTSFIALAVTVGVTVAEAKHPKDDREVGLVFWCSFIVSIILIAFINITGSIIYDGVSDREVVKHDVVGVESIGDVYRITLEDGTEKVLEDEDTYEFKVTVGDENILIEKKGLRDTVFFDSKNTTYELELAPSLNKG